MPGLSQYNPQRLTPRPGEEGILEPGRDPRNPALANNRLSDQDNANLDAMLRNLDTGAAAPGTLGATRPAMPEPQAQGQNPWLQWLMQYIQSKQQGQPR